MPKTQRKQCIFISGRISITIAVSSTKFQEVVCAVYFEITTKVLQSTEGCIYVFEKFFPSYHNEDFIT